MTNPPDFDRLHPRSIDYRQLLSDGNAPDGQVFALEKGKGRSGILAEQFAGVEQLTVAQPLGVKNMVMPATNQVEIPGTGQLAGSLGIMFDGNPQRSNRKGRKRAVVHDSAPRRATAGGDEMLIACIVAVDQMDLAVELFEIGQHERRDEIPAVEQQLRSLPIGPQDRPPEVGDMVVAVR